MIIKACMSCTSHEIKYLKDERSYCRKECCWAEYSKCVQIMAVNRFLHEENVIAVSPMALHHSGV